jgi:hypothetical protein
MKATGFEVCVAAAIRLQNGRIVQGRRHHDCFNEALREYPLVRGYPLGRIIASGDDQGFITSTGRYVTRKEGLELQLAAGVPSARGFYQNELYSEDLY